MSAFKTASKFVAEEIGAKELHHVPSETQAKSLKLLSVVEDGNIKEWSTADLPFEPEVVEGILSELRGSFIKTVDGQLGAELKGVFGCDLSIGSKVSYGADFEKFVWRKLENVDSLIQYLESRKFSTSINKKSSWGDYIRGIFSNSHSCAFKVVTSVVYTTSPTKITLTYESEFGGSATVTQTLSPAVGGEAGFEQSKVDTQVIDLQSGTPIAYGCVEVLVDKNGQVKVNAKEVFDGAMTLEEPSSSTSGALAQQ